MWYICAEIHQGRQPHKLCRKCQVRDRVGNWRQQGVERIPDTNSRTCEYVSPSFDSTVCEVLGGSQAYALVKWIGFTQASEIQVRHRHQHYKVGNDCCVLSFVFLLGRYHLNHPMLCNWLCMSVVRLEMPLIARGGSVGTYRWSISNSCLTLDHLLLDFESSRPRTQNYWMIGKAWMGWIRCLPQENYW